MHNRFVTPKLQEYQLPPRWSQVVAQTIWLQILRQMIDFTNLQTFVNSGVIHHGSVVRIGQQYYIDEVCVLCRENVRQRAPQALQLNVLDSWTNGCFRELRVLEFTVGNLVDYYYVFNKIFLLAINTTLVPNTQFITCIRPQCGS